MHQFATHMIAFIGLSLSVLSANANEKADFLIALFDRNIETVDLAQAKLEIDRLVDPDLDVAARLTQLDQMAKSVRNALPPIASSWQRIQALRDFIYEGGKWNNDAPFSYDHNDPLGNHIPNKLLSTYLDKRNGNCVTMPLLFLFLAERLDLNVTTSLAPLHVFVKFTDDEGKAWNLETTSGAGATRDVWYRQQLPMTDRAIEMGTYLRPLSKRENLAVIAAYLIEDAIARKAYEEAFELGEIIRHNYPDFAYVMVKQATALYYILQRDYYQRYPNPKDVPDAEYARVRWLQQQNHALFERAEELGWQPPVD